MLAVERVRALDEYMSSSMPSPGFCGTWTWPPMILSGSRVKCWPSCQIQCVSMAVSPRRGGGHVGEHGERDIKWLLEWLPQVSPSRGRSGPRARLPARVQKCGSARGCPRLQGQRVVELAPVGGDHVGGRGQASGAAELGHHHGH